MTGHFQRSRKPRRKAPAKGERRSARAKFDEWEGADCLRRGASADGAKNDDGKLQREANSVRCDPKKSRETHRTCCVQHMEAVLVARDLLLEWLKSWQVQAARIQRRWEYCVSAIFGACKSGVYRPGGSKRGLWRARNILGDAAVDDLRKKRLELAVGALTAEAVLKEKLRNESLKERLRKEKLQAEGNIEEEDERFDYDECPVCALLSSSSAWFCR